MPGLEGCQHRLSGDGTVWLVITGPSEILQRKIIRDFLGSRTLFGWDHHWLSPNARVLGLLARRHINHGELYLPYRSE